MFNNLIETKEPTIHVIFESVLGVGNVKPKKLSNGHISYTGDLQGVNEINRNTNFYPDDVIMEAIHSQRIADMVSRNVWFGELTHPYQKKDFHRCMEIIPTNISHAILEVPKLQGSRIISEIETVDPMGKTVVSWMERERSSILGHSMRGLTPYKFVKETPYRHNVIKKPMSILTYDIVFFPSHDKSLQMIDAKILTRESPLMWDFKMGEIAEFITTESGYYDIFRNELGIEIDKTKKITRVNGESAITLGLKDGSYAKMSLELDILKTIGSEL